VTAGEVAATRGLPRAVTRAAIPARATSAASGIHAIKHVVIIMQENRSFDSYFGTYPGADGIPMKNGVPTVCAPDPRTGRCVRPYHDRQDLNGGGPHYSVNSSADIAGGRMTGFIAQAELGRRGCLTAQNPACTNTTVPDVMGYHEGRDIPNYWTYARNFVLQDHMFAPSSSWSLPTHLYMVSAWSARCGQRNAPMSCRTNRDYPALPLGFLGTTQRPDYAWTDITGIVGAC